MSRTSTALLGLILALAARAAGAQTGPSDLFNSVGPPQDSPANQAPLSARPEAATSDGAAAKPRQEAPPLPLAAANRPAGAPGKSPGGLPSLFTVGGSLAVVLGLFLLFAWAMRRAPRGPVALPADVFAVLGRAPLAARQHVQLLRCGNKLLLVCVTQTGTETLTEVTDPEEVDRLAGLCHQAHPQSATAAFRQVFEQFAPGKTARAAYSSTEFDGDDV
jgi:flagellar protein FliO/FliZ